MTIQLQLFDSDPGDIIGVAYGVGVDSTGLLIGLHNEGVRPDFILFADVGAEKKSTYAYLPIIQDWLKSVHFPAVQIVQYIPKRAPYRTLEENMVMNATLPGATFGRGSCTAKWKIDPQDKWTQSNPICIAAKNYGRSIYKLIGFDAGEEYRRRKAGDKAHSTSNTTICEYPLMKWGWNREECKARIREGGLPVPPKSACIFCPNMKPHEIESLTPLERGRVIRMEITAEPYNRKVHGLWRRPRKSDGRPGSITQYIIDNDIDFTMPDDDMPLNPACMKGRQGWTFNPPHDAPNLSGMLEALAHDEIVQAV